MQLRNDIFFTHVEAMLAEGTDVKIRVKGYSMRPLLRDNRDVVTLTPTEKYVADKGPLKSGDVVLFIYRGKHILHRIARIDGQTITLAGDGNYRLTETCTEAQVLAVMTSITRRSGRTVDVASHRWRLQSRIWLALPPILRRIILRVLFALGIK